MGGKSGSGTATGRSSPPISEDSRLLGAIQDLGVDPWLSTASISTLQTIHDALVTARDAGLDLGAIRMSTASMGNTLGAWSSDGHGGSNVIINTDRFNDPGFGHDVMMNHVVNFTTSMTPRGIVMHELVHAAYRDQITITPKQTVPKSIWEQVSQYAGTHDDEFVAEVGAALLEGQQYPHRPEILREYARLGGPRMTVRGVTYGR